MAATVATIWGGQLFPGRPAPSFLYWGLVGLGAAGMVAGYTLLPHVRDRIDRFLDPASGDSYQIDTRDAGV